MDGCSSIYIITYRSRSVLSLSPNFGLLRGLHAEESTPYILYIYLDLHYLLSTL
jgi:hypothetical protein